VEKLFSFEYAVTGSWSDPKVEKLAARPVPRRRHESPTCSAFREDILHEQAARPAASPPSRWFPARTWTANLAEADRLLS
jgi:hypothetical protein